MLRRDHEQLAQQIRMVMDMHLNTIRLEGKMEDDDFYRLTDENGILLMAGWCCCDQWEHWESGHRKIIKWPRTPCARRCCVSAIILRSCLVERKRQAPACLCRAGIPKYREGNAVAERDHLLGDRQGQPR